MTNADVVKLAQECVILVKSRAVDAVRYCEAYEGTDQCIVFDGSAYGPSMRVLPRAGEVWQETPSTIPTSGRRSSTSPTRSKGSRFPTVGPTRSDPDSWVLAWEEGILWAYAPEHGQQD
jgi:hypothetical protein